MSNLSRKEAVSLLWNKGNISWKLDKNQLALYQAFYNSKNKVSVWLMSRRNGKSFALCVMAIETCIKTPNAVVKYVSPQQKQVKTIIKPLIRDIIKDAPPEKRPEFKTQDGIYLFPNGSEIQLAGADADNAENIRGGGANLCIVDEAGFVPDLDYLVKSVLLPTTVTTKGKIILSSTPPIIPDHPFEDYIKDAEAQGTLVKKTIFDNPRLTKENIDEIIKEYGGIDNPDFQREYLCELARDDSQTVIPEFSSDLQSKIVKEWTRPEFFDTYVSMDIGGRDFTVVLLAYLDFMNGKVIIEDEIVLKGLQNATDKLAQELQDKEASLWGGKKVYLRVADNNNLILLNDLHRLHKISFLPTAKDNADAALNNLRILLKQEKIIINPRCKTLIRHLKNAVWDTKKARYKRSAEDGHYDAVDACSYLCRNIQFYKNPYPSLYEFSDKGSIHIRDNKENSNYSKFKDLFKVKKSIRINK